MAGTTTHAAAGFPIRTPPDHRSVVTSPRLIADSHVLHRLLVPRHPPYALSNLETLENEHIDQKIIELSVTKNCLQDARVHYAVDKQHPHTRKPPTTKPAAPGGKTAHAASHPNSVPTTRHLEHQHHSNPTQAGRTQHQHKATRHFIDVPPSPNALHTLGTEHAHHQTAVQGKSKLLRKEVIQPHLPVRLPCYDLVPITDPTFDDSPQKAWAIGFGCYRLS